MKTKHTPTPWTYHVGAETRDGHKTFDVHKSTERCDCSQWIAIVTSIQSNAETAQANAAFIVLACNHHEELVEALEEIIDAYGGDGVEACECIQQPPHCAFCNARTLLTKLKGQP